VSPRWDFFWIGKQVLDWVNARINQTESQQFQPFLTF